MLRILTKIKKRFTSKNKHSGNFVVEEQTTGETKPEEDGGWAECLYKNSLGGNGYCGHPDACYGPGCDDCSYYQPRD